MKKSRKGSSGKKGGEQRKQSTATTQKLVDFLVRSAEVERKLEIVKEMLAEEEEFTPASLFHRLDSARKGCIVERDLRNFLADHGADFKGSELKMLFGRMNEAKQEEAVRLREFQNFILPNQNPRLRYFTVRRAVIIPAGQERLSPKVEWIACKFFSEVIQQYGRLMDLHQALLSSFDFDAAHIFALLSGNGEAITGEDLLRFVAGCGRDISKEEVGCLLRTIDRKGEGQLFLQDFKFFLATLGLKKEHQIFDELSPIPALRDSDAKRGVKDREGTLKERYRDNKSYVRGMDESGHHILGYSKKSESRSPGWLADSRKQ